MQAPRLCPQGRGDPEGCIFTKLCGWLQCLLQFEDHRVAGSEWTVSVPPQCGTIQLHQPSLPCGPRHLEGLLPWPKTSEGFLEELTAECGRRCWGDPGPEKWQSDPGRGHSWCRRQGVQGTVPRPQRITVWQGRQT